MTRLRRLTGRAALAALLAVVLAPAARAQQTPDAGAPAAEPDPAGTQAAAAQRAAQDAEAQVLELRRQVEALERERAGYDDVRRRLDALDAHQVETDRDVAAARAVPPDSSPIRFHDDGFSIRSPDNGFDLHPMLRIQGVYTGEIASRGPMDSAAPDISSFSLARAEVILEGHVGGPFFQYRFQYDPAEPEPLKDAYVAWRPFRLLTIQVGQFKVPYSLQRQYWKADLEFVGLAAPTTAFSLERDLGVMLVGRILPGKLTVQAAVLNGAGANVANDNIDLAYALRVVATPFGPVPATEGDIEGHVRPVLAVGASGYFDLVPTDIQARTADPSAVTDVDGNGRIDNVAVWQAGLELRALWLGASLQAEWYGRLEEPGAGQSSRSFWGGYVQGSYFVIPHRLQVGARAAHTDLPLYGATLEQHLLAGTYQNEESGVVSLYVHGHRVKVQADYSHLTSDGQSAPTADRVRLAMQVGF